MEPVILDKKTASSIALTDNIEDYPDGIIIPIDKPYRWTSADVIRKVKYAAIRHFGKKNLKVGHAGTLDPLATGVLLVCIGKATKLAETLQAHDKEYIAEVVFGATTPSYDLEKEIDRHFPYGHITKGLVAEALEDFRGEQDQVAPLFSAKSVDGVRAYELARKLFKEQGRPRQDAGEDAAEKADGDVRSSAFDEKAESVIRTARINISDIELLDFREAAPQERVQEAGGYSTEHGRLEQPGEPDIQQDDKAEHADKEGKATEGMRRDASSRINVTDNSALGLPAATIRIECSKGTYIRAVARDLGEAVGSGAHLGSLRRSRSGDFRVTAALTIDQAIAILSNSSSRCLHTK